MCLCYNKHFLIIIISTLTTIFLGSKIKLSFSALHFGFSSSPIVSSHRSWHNRDHDEILDVQIWLMMVAMMVITMIATVKFLWWWWSFGDHPMMVMIIRWWWWSSDDGDDHNNIAMHRLCPFQPQESFSDARKAAAAAWQQSSSWLWWSSPLSSSWPLWWSLSSPASSLWLSWLNHQYND